MAQVPPGFHKRRATIAKNPTPRVKRASPWVIGGVVVVLLWAWAHGGSDDGTTPAPQPSVSASVGAAAGR